MSDATDPPLMSREEQLMLYRLKVERELQERIISWAQLRLAVVATVVSVLVGGGVFYSINNNITTAVKDVVLTETGRQIKVMEATRERAVTEMEQLNFQSKIIERFVDETRNDLRRTKTDATEVAAQVKETQPQVRDMIESMKRLKANADEEQKKAKEFSFSFSEYFQEQQFRAKSDMNEMRANIELLERGFAVIEDLAAAIRQKEPRSELARQFAGFSERWQEARTAYDQRLSDLRRRRAIKVIHYSRPESSPERKRTAQNVIVALQEAGFTVDEWQTPTGLNDFKSAEQVASEFGLPDPRVLLDPTVIIHPRSTASDAELRSILANVGITLSPARLVAIEPAKPDILSGGGAFRPETVVLISDLGR